MIDLSVNDLHRNIDSQKSLIMGTDKNILLEVICSEIIYLSTNAAESPLQAGNKYFSSQPKSKSHVDLNEFK